MRTTPIRRRRRVLIAALGLLTALPLSGAELNADLLVYRVQPPGEQADINRLLVTPGFLRLDRGAQDDGYILYDRQQRVIYSVNREDHSILVIDPPPISEQMRAQAPSTGLQSVEPVDAPEVGGVKPQQWRLSAAGRVCREAFVLPGLMPQATTAYAEFLDTLARQQAVALPAMPPEFQDPCDSAIHVFSPSALLQKGTILKAWDDQGYLEELLDYRSGFPIPQSDLSLPEDYRRTPMTSGI